MIIKGDDAVNIITINSEIECDKLEVHIGALVKTYEPVEFPLEVTLSQSESSGLQYSNSIYVVKYKDDIKTTFRGYGNLKVKQAPTGYECDCDGQTIQLVDCVGEQEVINLTISQSPVLTSQDGSVVITPTADGYDLQALGGGGGSGGTMNHAQLLNRNLENQHPISAITDLQKTLDAKQPTGDYALKSEIPDVSNFVLENELTTVAKTGSYNDLSDTPEIPSTQGLATETYVENAVKGKQDILISGVTLKTVNNLSLLGSGNIDITGGGGSSDVTKAYVDQQDELLSNRIDGKTDEAYVDAQIATRQPVGAYVIDADYVHTDNNFTTAEKEKLNSLSNYNDSDVRQLIGDNSQEIADLDLVKADRSEIPSITGLATEGYVNTAVSGKQDTLIAGANITITNNVISASSGGGSVDAVWGSITGTLSNQTDLKLALDGKQSIGDYALSSELPTKTSDLTNDSGFLTSIPSDVVRDSDLSTVATSGSYNDLSDKPVIPTDTVTEAELQAVADSIPDTSSLATKTELNNKVDKVSGKGLSTNDFTSAEKTKLASLENYDDTSLVAQIQTKQDKTEKITISKADAEGGYAFLDNKDYVVSEGISTLVISSATGAGSIRFATLSGFALDVGSLKTVGEHTFEENTQYDIAYIDGWVYVSQGVAI